MAGVKGRHEARKRVCHRANTFQRAAPEFHDRVSGQQHVGTQPWGLPVLGPCQWHRPYRARSRSNRARTSADGGAREAPSPVDGTSSSGPNDWRGQDGVAGEGQGATAVAATATGERGDDARPRRSRISAECHPIPVGLPRRFSAS